MQIHFLALFVITSSSIVLLTSCQGSAESKGVAEPTRSPTLIQSPSPAPTERTLSPDELCSRLKDVKKIPYAANQKAGDPIYDGLLENGFDSVPCLIEKITDTTAIPDPRVAPPYRDFKVGDAAVFSLLLITDQNWDPEGMFPAEVADHWKENGVYTYFAFVEDASNRKRVQQWWKQWAKKNLRKSDENRN